MTVPTTARAAPSWPYSASFALLLAAAIVLSVGLPLAAPIARANRAVPSLEFGRASAGGASGAITFILNATDAPAFQPTLLSGAVAGQTVEITVHNNGSFPHTFTLARQANVLLNPSWSPAALDGYFAQNGSFLNLSVAAGGTVNGSFLLPANASGGTFEFVSLVPYQFQSGMHGTMVVGAGAPSITLTDQALASLAFEPNILVANATSYPVTLGIQVSNVGALIHTWTLSALPNVEPTPANFTTYFAQHPPAVNLQILNPGVAYNATFILDAPGVYEFICEEPGHFQAGMFGMLYVGVPPPAAPTPLSTALVQADVLVLAGVLVLFSVILALSVNFMGKFPPRRPTHH
ncbi:MAG: plastocyanin/azurin family copper-binding protein [Thermoplasmata archaeon]